MKFRKPRFKYTCTEPDVTVEATENEVNESEPRRAKFGWGWRSVYILLGISAIIYVISLLSVPFSDFFNRYISSWIRAFLALLTSWIPFSIAEVILILLLPAFIAIIIIACHWHCGSWRNIWAFAGKLLAVAAVLLVMFVWGFGTGYRTSTLDIKLGLDKKPVSAAELRQTADILTEKVNEMAKEVEFEYQGFSIMPYSLSEMNDKLLEAYDKASEKYDFIPRMYSRIKPVMLSELMSYTHITGVYSYFTGEANLNVAFPDYTLPFTAAHELAHQRGIAREDEANFVAYLVCLESDDAYIRYSGYLNMLEYVTNAYYKADASEKHADYFELRKMLSLDVRYEQQAYSEFFKKYEKNIAADVSGAINDTYLQIHGTPGTVSYGLVVDLAVAYYKLHG